LDRVGAVALRMMAGAVSPATRRSLQQRVRGAPSYPWEAVVDTVLADPVDEVRLLERGLAAQRDWVVGSAKAPLGRRLRQRGRSAVAWLLSRVIFFALYTAAAIVLLVLVRWRWPDLDIYVLGEWLRRVFPGVFGHV
jgi:hypothetical protein